MPYFLHNGANIYYEKKGNWESTRRPVVLLHGNGESMEIFDKAIEPLLSKYPFLAIDTRGHGKSEITNDDYNLTYEIFADDVYNLVKSLEIHQVDVVGFSDGAIVALLLASGRATASCVMRVISVGANVAPNGLKAFARNEISLEKRIADARHKRLESALCSLMLNQPNISANDLANIYATVAVVAGSHDIIKRSHSEYIAAAIIHAKLIIVDGADHMIPQKFPEKLRSIILDELD